MKDLLGLVVAFGIVLAVDRLITTAIDCVKRRRKPRRPVYVYMPINPSPDAKFIEFEEQMKAKFISSLGIPAALFAPPAPVMAPPRFEIPDDELAALEAHFRPQPRKEKRT